MAYLRLNAVRSDIGPCQEQVHAEHEAIRSALREHDPVCARGVMTLQLRHNRQQLEQLVEQLTADTSGRDGTRR